MPATVTPPPGFTAMANSRRVGFHRHNAEGGYDYWYPGEAMPGPAPKKVPKKPSNPTPSGTPDIALPAHVVHALREGIHKPSDGYSTARYEQGTIERLPWFLGDHGLHLHHPAVGKHDHPLEHLHFARSAMDDLGKKHPHDAGIQAALHATRHEVKRWTDHENSTPRDWMDGHKHDGDAHTPIERAARAVASGKEPNHHDLIGAAADLAGQHPSGLSFAQAQRTLPHLKSNPTMFHHAHHQITAVLKHHFERAIQSHAEAKKASMRPPPGYNAIPNSLHGGYVHGAGAAARYWYPSRRAATEATHALVGKIAHHAKAAFKAGAMGDLTGDAKYSKEWAEHLNAASDLYRADLVGHVAEVERHEQAEAKALASGRGGGRVFPATAIPERRKLRDAVREAHRTEGRLGAGDVVQIVRGMNPGYSDLALSQASDADLLQAAAGTAVRYGQHAEKLHDALYADQDMRLKKAADAGAGKPRAGRLTSAITVLLRAGSQT